MRPHLQNNDTDDYNYLIALRATRPRAMDSGARQPTNRQPTNQKTSKATSQQTNKPTTQQTNKATNQPGTNKQENQQRERLIHTLMGNDVALRKDFITSNAINVKNLDI